MDCYAAYARDIDVRKSGSSGGLFPVISRQYIEDGAIVYASVYNRDFSVQFERIDSLELLEKSFTSKYVQSNAEYVYERVMEDLINKKSVLFCGTPCQVKALHKFLRTKKVDTKSLLTIDIICHGVPSFLLLESYLETFPNNSKIISLNMRNKDKGWNWGNYSWKFNYDDGECTVIKQAEVPFMKAFLSNTFLRYSCYACKSKTSHADITLGDFWGISNTNIKVDDRYGVSCVIIHSQKGQEAFLSLTDRIDYMQAEFNDIAISNSALIKSVNKPYNRRTAYKELKKTKNIIAYLNRISEKSVFDRGASKVYRAVPHKKTRQNLISSSGRKLKTVQQNKEDCCGCMVCMSICPKNAISRKFDLEGFVYPVIEESKCVNCKLCIDVCPQAENEKR